MDSTVPDIIFNKKGYCNYCNDFKDKYFSNKSASKTLKECLTKGNKRYKKC